MNEGHVDDLARLAAAGLPRRRLFTSLPAGVVVALAQSGRSEAAACKKTGKRCERNGDCCANAECRGKKCRCKRGFTDCRRKCYRLDSDEKHCGRCNKRCATGERCCNGTCVDLEIDGNNCGSCGNACTGDDRCVAGACLDRSICPPGADSCSETGNVPCGISGDCVCSPSTEGETVCGRSIPNVFCGSCDTSLECQDAHGPGSFCARTMLPCCGPATQNVCRRRCKTAEAVAE